VGVAEGFADRKRGKRKDSAIQTELGENIGGHSCGMTQIARTSYEMGKKSSRKEGGKVLMDFRISLELGYQRTPNMIT